MISKPSRDTSESHSTIEPQGFTAAGAAGGSSGDPPPVGTGGVSGAIFGGFKSSQFGSQDDAGTGRGTDSNPVVTMNPFATKSMDDSGSDPEKTNPFAKRSINVGDGATGSQPFSFATPATSSGFGQSGFGTQTNPGSTAAPASTTATSSGFGQSGFSFSQPSASASEIGQSKPPSNFKFTIKQATSGTTTSSATPSTFTFR